MWINECGVDACVENHGKKLAEQARTPVARDTNASPPKFSGVHRDMRNHTFFWWLSVPGSI